MATPICTLFVSQACLKVDKNPIIDIGLYNSKTFVFIRTGNLSLLLSMLFATQSSYLND